MTYEILELIGKVESDGMYNRVYGAGVRTEPLTSMTIDEVLHWQKEYVKVYGSPSSAAGKYQIIRNTLKRLVDKMDIKKDVLFNEEVQDAMAVELLKECGFFNYLDGKMTMTKMMTNLAKVWASLPVPVDVRRGDGTLVKAGSSYYSGDGLNKALISIDEVKQALLKDKMNNKDNVSLLDKIMLLLLKLFRKGE